MSDWLNKRVLRVFDWLIARTGGHDHGRHRQAPEAPSRGAPNRAGSADAGTAGEAAAVNITHWPGATTAAGIGAGAAGAGGMTGMLSAGFGGLSAARFAALGQATLMNRYQQAMAGASPLQRQLDERLKALDDQVMAQLQAQHLLAAAKVRLPPPDPEPEDAGITVGEIIAWRAWKVKDGLLTSMYRDDLWPPDEPITGDPGGSGCVENTRAGVHAFTTQKGALEYAIAHANGSVMVNGSPVVIGRVALWGEVIEHEQGYRAEFAKVHSLDVPLGVDDATMARLRTLYVKAHRPAERE